MAQRIFYAAAGPGDVIRAHRAWRAGSAATGQVSVTFSSQIADFCAAAGADACLISPHADRATLTDGRFRIEHRPKRATGSGLGWHVEEVRYGLMLAARAVRFRADLALLDVGCTHVFVMHLFRLCGIAVVPILHNTLWPAGHPPRGRLRRMIRALDRTFWRRGPAGVVGVSRECLRQVETEAPDARYPMVEARAQFDRAYFTAIPPPPPAPPFEVLFVGRAEADKGVLDLPAMARLLEDRAPGLVRWTVCGDGGALAELRRRVAAAGLEAAFDIAGWVTPEALPAYYARAHAAIVPTRSSFAEGMAMTAAQAVCAGRPVVTNTVVPAWEALGDACLVATPDDPASHAEAVYRLATDPALYARAAAACPGAAEPFLNGAMSLDRALAVATGVLTPSS